MAKQLNKNSQAYWKKRMDEICAHTDQTDMEFFYELQSIYTESAQQIQKEIYSFYSKYARENEITYQEAKKRLMREDLSDYRDNAKIYFKQTEKDPELLKRLNEQYQAGKVTRMEALYLELTYQQGLLSGKLHNSFDSYLKAVAKYAYRKVSGGQSASTLNKPALEQLVKTPFNGKNYSQSIWDNTDDLAQDLKRVLKTGFITGKGPADIARELRKKYNVARSRAEAIVRTDGTNIINNATIQRFLESGLTKYEFMAHIDSRTTEICKKQHKKVYLIEEYQPGKNAPPMHVGCRSTILPDAKEIGMEPDWDKKAEKTTKKRAELKQAKNDYNEFKKIMKQEMPSFDKFRELKYNGGSEWEQLKDNYFVKSRLKDGRYNSVINPDKQAPHMKSTVAKGKSYFNDDVDIQELLDKYAGTGNIERDRNGRSNKEIVYAKEFEGIVVNQSNEIKTNYFKIHYSKKRTHIVPYEGRNQE